MDKYLFKKAFELRKKILKIVINRGGHLATSFSCLDILVVLFYGKILNFNYLDPKWRYRDRFVLSKGHAETAMYAVLDDLNFFPKSYLANHYRQGKFLLGGHIDGKIPGVEFTTGALGHGLSLACGSALALKKNFIKSKIFVLLSDGECTEGSVWEAAIFASKHKLNNLIAIIDYNKMSATDYLDNFTDLSNLGQRFKAFGWDVFSVNGHDIKSMRKLLLNVKKKKLRKPTIFLAKTIKGKGINFIENDPSRHSKGLSKDEENQAKLIFDIK